MFIRQQGVARQGEGVTHAAVMTLSTLAAASAWRAAGKLFAKARPGYQARGRLRPALKIALFSGNYNCVRDGANQALNRLVRYLIDVEGAEVRIYSPVAAVPAFPPAGDLVAVRSLPLPGRSEYRLALGLPAAIRKDIAAFAPDIVHLSAPDLLGRAAQCYAREHAIPVVASLHTRFETYFRYYGLQWLRPAAEAWLSRFYHGSDCILTPTPGMLSEMAALGHGDRVRLWGRGIDPAAFNPGLRDNAWRHAHGYADEEVVPLFFGRLVLEKGLDVFAAAIALLRERGHRIRPLIVGAGPARGWFAERLPNAVFAGHLSGTALGTAVASADILLNPSLTEAFGNVTLEAMASGLAVIGPDVGSTRHLIEHGRTGLLLPANTPASFADAFEHLLAAPDDRVRMARSAAWEAKRHSWDNANSAVMAAYRETLQVHSARAAHR